MNIFSDAKIVVCYGWVQKWHMETKRSLANPRFPCKVASAKKANFIKNVVAVAAYSRLADPRRDFTQWN